MSGTLGLSAVCMLCTPVVSTCHLRDIFVIITHLPSSVCISLQLPPPPSPSLPPSLPTLHPSLPPSLPPDPPSLPPSFPPSPPSIPPSIPFSLPPFLQKYLAPQMVFLSDDPNDRDALYNSMRIYGTILLIFLALIVFVGVKFVSVCILCYIPIS